MSWLRFSINNPLLINLILFLITLAGLFTWYGLPQEMFPLVEQDKVRITTLFDGASPEEVERQVTLPIEQEFDGMAEIDVIKSISSEGSSSIIIELKSGTDVDEFIRDADSLLDRIIDLPDESEKPVLNRLETRFPVISMALYGDISRGELYEWSEWLKRRASLIDGVASVGVAGDQEWEIWVEVDPQKLAIFGISLSKVRQALFENMRDLPGGRIQSNEGDILLRGIGTQPKPESIKDIALATDSRGGQLKLSEVATISIRLEEAKTLGRFNGKPSVNLTVNKTTDASTIEVARLIKQLAEEVKQELPQTIEVGLFSDLSVYVKNRLDTVKSSGLIGLILVLLSLYLFLNIRVALVTAVGIPVSFLFAIILIGYYGYTINMVSLFAFLIALGMIVDDAIIVNENIYRHMESGMPVRDAAITGAKEVFWPVMASTATTIAAFLPMYVVGGTMGAFIAVIPAVVTFALLGSLFEAFLVLPSHAVEWMRHTPKKQSRVDWKKWLNKYSQILRWGLERRYFVMWATVSVLVIVVSFAATRVPFRLFGHVNVGQFFVNIETPKTYRLEDSSRLADQLEDIILGSMGERELSSLLTNVGITFINFNQVVIASNQIQLMVDLKPQAPEGFIERWVTPVMNLNFDQDAGTRERDTEVIINQIRQQLEQIAGIEKMSILRAQGGPAGAEIEIGITGPDVRRLGQLADEMKRYIERIPGAKDVGHDLQQGKLEFRYQLNDRGRELGLTQATLAESIRAGFQGLEVTYVNRGDKRIPLRLIFPEQLRYDAESLQQLPITLADGRTVFLADVATLTMDRGLSSVTRRDQQRLVTITSEVDADVTTPLEVTEQIQNYYKDFSENNPGYELIWMGEKQETNKSMQDMFKALLLALVIIFVILTALFKSLLDPFVVMFAIPFGLIGVVFGHWTMGLDIQFLSVIGFLALSGIVVNDSLILLDFAKRNLAMGEDRIEAMLHAGRVRARPIILTSITTFLGISPLIFFASGQTAFLSPMAVSLGFGLLFATVLILFSLPCVYLVADDIRIRLGRQK